MTKVRHTAQFKKSDLVRCTKHHYRWACICGVYRTFGEGALVIGRAPVCECGEYMCPVNPDEPPS